MIGIFAGLLGEKKMYEKIGPIHRWLYQKIVLQDFITEHVLQYARMQGWTNQLDVKVDEIIGKNPVGKLEEVADSENIHEWLNHLVEISEKRFAFVVMRILEEDMGRMDALEKLMFALGRMHMIGDMPTMMDVAQIIENSFLNGMPCDHVLQTEELGDKILMKRTINVHELYWNLENGTAEMYDRLMDSCLKGMLFESKIQVERNGNNLILR